MPVRSTSLETTRINAPGLVTLFTVPVNTTVLVKSLYGSLITAGPATITFSVQYPPAVAIQVASVTLTAAGPYRWDGWLALDPGAVFLVNSSTAGVNYTVVASGAVLPGAVPELPGTKPAP